MRRIREEPDVEYEVINNKVVSVTYTDNAGSERRDIKSKRPTFGEWIAIVLIAIPGAFIGAVAIGYALEIMMGTD